MLLTGLPLAAAFGASALKLYPIGNRFSLYLLPFLVLAAAKGWEETVNALQRLTVVRQFTPTAVHVAAVVVVLTAPVVAIARNMPPFHLEHVRPAIEHMRAHWQPGDKAYVYYGAGQAFLFYAPRFDFAPSDYMVGTCARATPDTYIRELDMFRGHPRLWTLFAHANMSGLEFVQLREYLDRVGRRLDAVEIPAEGAHLGAGAYAYLHDLSNPANVNLDPPQATDLWPLTCYGTMSPEVRGQVGALGR